MNTPQWFPHRGQPAKARPEEEPSARQGAPVPQAEIPRPGGGEAAVTKGHGAITGRDLSQLSSLTRPFVRDPFYRLRPPFAREAAELSLELANMTYTLDLDPWAEAGWNDFSIQIDDTLQSGMTHGGSADGERMQNLISAWKMLRAKAALRELNPVAQVMSALRQRERSDTIKAVCMMHSMEGGGYLLAIGFMGTGKRFYDWISNFRFTTEEGFHKGFYQLCTYFEQGAESIVFPKTAAELGLEKLTLGEVLSEMKSARSRFRLWMAGHSQGGAVMQVFTHRLITDWGVLPQNITGYGFASPTVATGRLVYDPAAYPLYHIINSDDMVPRMGALLHLGLCLSFQSDDKMREATYGLSALPADIAARETIRSYQRQMVDTASILLYSTAFMQCMAEEKGEEGLNSLMSKKWSFAPIDRVLALAGDKAMDWLDRLVENAQNGHAALTGRPMDEAELTRLRDSMRPMMHEIPFRRLMGAVLSYCVPPHHIMRNQQKEQGAYAYIVENRLDELRPFIWLNPKDSAPVRRYGELAALRAQTREVLRAAVPAHRKGAAVGAKARAQALGVQRTGIGARRGLRSAHR